MASWFYASEGKQQGPFPEGQFRELIAQGVVRPDTLVWSEGMAGWQKAAEIPGLIGGSGAPPMVPAGGPPVMGGGDYGGAGGGSLSVDFGIFDFTWRTIVAVIGCAFVFVVSIITIIGWAWVYVAWIRWFCRNIQGTRREVVFVGSGLEFLWRSIVIAIASSFIIPIPWMYRWKMRWLASQTELAPRGSI